MTRTVDDILGGGSWAEARAEADGVKEFLARLNDEDRLTVLAYIAEGFCVNCGRRLDPAPFNKCHCTNDE